MTWARFLAGCVLALAGACATYRDDLDRSVEHYNARAYDRALALLEVLEPDIDSLSEAERAQYAYYRGMSHFLLDQRLHARHWLGRAAAREKNNAGSLNPDELKKVEDTLTELNKDRYGGSEVAPPEEVTCNVDTDCVKGKFCDNGVCKKASSAGESKEKKDQPKSSSDDDDDDDDEESSSDE